jgi:diguanylate cyclase (GGDEF)-like protein
MLAAGDRLELGDHHLRRERLLDMEERIRPYRLATFGVLALALIVSGPILGWAWLLPLTAALGAFYLGDKLRARSARPEVWAALTWGVSPLMIALSVALTGAEASPAIAWFALPAVTLGARFENRGVVIGVAYTTVLLMLATVGLDPAGSADEPLPIVFAFALTVAVALLGGALVQSDRDHRREAILDPLTGLLNRSALAQRFAELNADSRDPQRAGKIGVLIGDLDHFKLVNDEHGHAVGDAVLKDVGYTLRKHLRALDNVYRVGGEEFVVVLPGAGGVEGAREVAERLRTQVAASRPGGLKITISFGAVASDGTAELDFDTLYRAADSALYEAKQAGRNSVRVGRVAEDGQPTPVPA